MVGASFGSAAFGSGAFASGALGATGFTSAGFASADFICGSGFAAAGFISGALISGAGFASAAFGSADLVSGGTAGGASLGREIFGSTRCASTAADADKAGAAGCNPNPARSRFNGVSSEAPESSDPFAEAAFGSRRLPNLNPMNPVSFPTDRRNPNRSALSFEG
jgi:hypothetical protein